MYQDGTLVLAGESHKDKVCALVILCWVLMCGPGQVPADRREGLAFHLHSFVSHLSCTVLEGNGVFQKNSLKKIFRGSHLQAYLCDPGLLGAFQMRHWKDERGAL